MAEAALQVCGIVFYGFIWNSMLNYGAYSQVQFGYNTDDLAKALYAYNQAANAYFTA